VNAPPVIEVAGVGRRFGRTVALDAVDLTVSAGSVYGLVGENGAGKTTLVRHILGLLRAHSGSVRVFGLDPVARPPEVLAQVGYLAENHELPNWLRLDEYLRYLETFYPAWDRELAARLSDRFELDTGRKLGRLSKGQRARAALVGALAYRPRLLILDEPSSGLDPLARRDLLEAVIRSVVEDGRTVFFSSHLLEEVERVADRIAMLETGRLVFDSTMDEVLEEHHLVTVRFEEVQWEPPTIEAALSCQGSGRDWTVLFADSPENWRPRLAEHLAEIVGVRSASLEEIFLSRARGRRA